MAKQYILFVTTVLVLIVRRQINYLWHLADYILHLNLQVLALDWLLSNELFIATTDASRQKENQMRVQSSIGH